MKRYEQRSYKLDETELKNSRASDPYGLGEDAEDAENITRSGNSKKNGTSSAGTRLLRTFLKVFLFSALGVVLLGGGVYVWKVCDFSRMRHKTEIQAVKRGDFAGHKRTLTVDGIEYVFRWCPRGKFMMGSPETEKGRTLEEAQHRVSFEGGFWLLQTEVTREMWTSVMGGDPPPEEEKHLPAAVSWKEAQRFCRKLTQKAAFRIELPTEAQWEYACRAGTDRPFAAELKRVAWYAENAHGKMQPVKRRKGNNWFLYDMHGNAPEWCRDLYDADFYAKSPDSDPEGPTFGRFHVVRGGSYEAKPEQCRAAARDSQRHYAEAGFRVVIECIPKKK